MRHHFEEEPVAHDCSAYKRTALEEMARRLKEFHPDTKGSKTRLKHANMTDLCAKLGLPSAASSSSPVRRKSLKKCAARATKTYDIYTKEELVEKINSARRAVSPDTTDLLTLSKARKISYTDLCQELGSEKSKKSKDKKSKKSKKSKDKKSKDKKSKRKDKKSKRKDKKSKRKDKKSKRKDKTKRIQSGMADEEIRAHLSKLTTNELIEQRNLDSRVVNLIDDELNYRASMGVRKISSYFPRASSPVVDLFDF